MSIGWVIFATVFFLLGGARTWWELRRMRRAAPPPDAVASLRDEPLGAWQQQPAAAVAMWLHLGAVVVLVGVYVGELVVRGRGPTLFNVPAVAFVAFVAGVLGSVPIAQRSIRPAIVHLAPWGIAESGGTFAWERFGRCEADPATGIVRLYARRHRWFPLVVWRLPERAEYDRAVELIEMFRGGARARRRGGADGPVPGRSARTRPPVATDAGVPGAGPWALVLAAAALVVPPVLGAIALALAGSGFITAYAIVAVVAVVGAWNPVFERFTD